MQNLGIAWRLTSQAGWGVLAVNLARELLRRRAALPVPLTDEPSLAGNPLLHHALAPSLEAWKRVEAALGRAEAKPVSLKFPVIHSLGNDLALHPKGRRFRGAKEYGIAFVDQNAFSAEARERAKRFDVIFAGCRWNHQLLSAAGIEQSVAWAQGVDLSVFHPAPKAEYFPGRFVVFSGGKPEFRKGQDLVLAGFKAFQQRRRDALLLTCWYTHWPSYAKNLAWSPHVTAAPLANGPHSLDIAGWLRDEGLPVGSFLDVGMVPNPLMPNVLRAADAALFPNRCEGGTNLVAMECLACGLPTILSKNTGHLDLIETVACSVLQRQGPVSIPGNEGGYDDWGESDVEEIVETLDALYLDRQAAAQQAAAAAAAMQSWSWQDKIAELLQHLDLTLTG